MMAPEVMMLKCAILLHGFHPQDLWSHDPYRHRQQAAVEVMDPTECWFESVHLIVCLTKSTIDLGPQLVLLLFQSWSRIVVP